MQFLINGVHCTPVHFRFCMQPAHAGRQAGREGAREGALCKTLGINKTLIIWDAALLPAPC